MAHNRLIALPGRLTNARQLLTNQRINNSLPAEAGV